MWKKTDLNIFKRTKHCNKCGRSNETVKNTVFKTYMMDFCRECRISLGIKFKKKK